ncbi:MAG: BCCT family transporter [Planctomycetales bacterium]|nr:BCCT family transporter [Planctomycetales bacterium]
MAESNGEATVSARPKLNHFVFWPPFVLMLGTAIANLLFPDRFGVAFKTANDWLIDHLGWLFVTCAFASLGMCVWVFCSPLGAVRIGGRDARPMLRFWDWFAITLCTTVAVGILFWSTAEPVSHFMAPPQSLGLEPGSNESAGFAMSALFLHWTFIPYSIYAAASLVFAFAHHNMRLPFSIGSTLVPILGQRLASRLGRFVDGLCLFALVAGMAASLGTGILTIAGGFNELWSIPSNVVVWGIIAAAIVATFIVSSATGLMNGIRLLSDINAKILLLLGVVVLFLGPTWSILTTGFSGVGEFARRFFPLGLHLSLVEQDPWCRDWSIFYWAVWLAWTPVTACFLGRIAYGRTVRQFLTVNLILPSLFCIFWMSVFGTTALDLQRGGLDLYALVASNEYESVSYAVLKSLPWGTVMMLFYLASAFVCFVTSADSNTSAMAGISSDGVSLENPEGALATKIAWGLLVGIASWAMIAFANVDGIRYLSNLGGFPAAILMIFVLASLVVILFRFRQLNLADAAEPTDKP